MGPVVDRDLPGFQHQTVYTQNPNMVFGRVFQWFLEQYGQSNETERHKNRARMETDGGEETPLGRTQARADWDVLNMEF